MSKYKSVSQSKYPKFYCNKCGERCVVTKAAQDYDSRTGERNYKYWVKCPNYRRIKLDSFWSSHQNEGAHLLDNAWSFSSGWY